MNFYFRNKKSGLTYLYYNVDNIHMDYIISHQYRNFPIRFFNKQYFCPFLNEEYARKIALEQYKNTKSKCIHILRFLVKDSLISEYNKGTLDEQAMFINIPYDNLNHLNKNIVGYIEKINTIEL